MTERYDKDAAAHYAAYRPALHETILSRALGPSTRFGFGIDVGCGTGCSTVALAKHCGRTLGIDPSESMLRNAEPHQLVSYLLGTGESIPVTDGTADVFTFAGSLYYADSPALRNEVQRVGQSGAVVLAYDFELQLNPLLRSLGIDLPEFSSGYDHTVNFSGRNGFLERAVESERLQVEMSASNFAHVVLSDSHRLDYLAKQYGTASTYDAVVRMVGHGIVKVTAVIYFSSYVLE